MTSRKHVLMLLANGFRPDPRVHKEARTLLAHGYAVTIFALDRDCDLAERERIDGIEVVRTRVGRVTPGQPASIGPALARFTLTAIGKARTLAAERAIDVVHCHDLDTVPLGLALRSLLRAKLVYDMHDLYSSFFTSRALERVVDAVDRRAYALVDAHIIVNEGFLQLEGVDAAKCALVMNVPKRADAARCSETDVGLFYAGNIESRRDMRYALPPIAEAGLTAQFAGDGPLLDAHRNAADPMACKFLGRIAHAEVMERTRRCLAVLALYDTRVHNNRLATPNKLFDAMKFGKPVIVCEGSVAADIVRSNECGLIVEYGDRASFVRALEVLEDPLRYETMCVNAFRAFEREYHWERMEQRLLELYARLVA